MKEPKIIWDKEPYDSKLIITCTCGKKFESTDWSAIDRYRQHMQDAAEHYESLENPEKRFNTFWHDKNDLEGDDG